uniref:Putative e3 ubiquitin-protein ligase bre1 n=1 Tax=Panstrongylus lignarius TaxID=156445 RepID=A0A224XQ79_9HEMI
MYKMLKFHVIITLFWLIYIMVSLVGCDKEKSGSSPIVKKEGGCSSVPGGAGVAATAAGTGVAGNVVKKEVKKEAHRDQHRTKEVKPAESELVRDLKAQLKKTVNEQKES